MTTRRRMLAALLALSHLAGLACDGPEEPGHDHAAHETLPASEPLSGTSIFHLDSTWTDQHGQLITLREFSGKIVVLALVYTHCEAACPRIIADMRRIRGALGPTGDPRVGLVLVSIDPGRDSVERLRDFGLETGLTEQGWTLLRGNDGDVRELAAVFGVQYSKTSDTDFAHSNVIHVVDSHGEIAHQQLGLGADPKATVAAIRELLVSSEGR